MDITQLSDDLSATGQIGADDLTALKARGFRSLICNRPDGEQPDQPDWAAIEAAAQAAGFETRFIPIAGPDDIAAKKGEFAAALDELPGPTLAFCRTGNRSSMLYRATQVND